MIYLTEADVAATDCLPAVIDAVRDTFVAIDAGTVVDMPRRRIGGGGAMLHAMGAIHEPLGFVGYKNYVTRRDGAHFVVGLHDLATGAPVAFIEADLLGRWRTAAATAVAAEIFRPPADRPLRLLLIGTGKQAETHLEALRLTLPIDRVDVFARDAARREAFAERIGRADGPEVIAIDDPDNAVPEADLIVTATTSKTPVFDGTRLDDKRPAGGNFGPKAFVAAIGSNSPSRREVDRETISRASLVVCDSIEACRAEAGELIDAAEAGSWDWGRADELAPWVTPRVLWDPDPADVVLFDSVGLASEDVAAAAAVLGRHRGDVGVPEQR